MKRDKEIKLCTGMDLKPIITSFYFLVRQLSRLMSFTHLSLVFPLFFGGNIIYGQDGVDPLYAAPGVIPDEDGASRPAGKSLDGMFPEKLPAREPGVIISHAAQINVKIFRQDKKVRGKIFTPGSTPGMESHVHSIRFLTKYARDVFPGFEFAPLSKVLGGVGTLFQKGSDPPGANVVVDLGGMGLTTFSVVNRNLGFLNEVIRPKMVQVSVEQEPAAISHPAAEKVHVDHVDHVNHVGRANFFPARNPGNKKKFTAGQDRTAYPNISQTGARQAIQPISLPTRHFLETQQVDAVPGVAGKCTAMRMRTYDITPALSSLAFAGNYLQTRFIPSTSWHSYSANVLSGTGPRLFQRVLSGEKPVSIQPSKRPFGPSRESLNSDLQLPVLCTKSPPNFSSFIIHHSSFPIPPLVAGGTLSPLLRSLSVCNDYIQTQLLNLVSRNSHALQQQHPYHIQDQRQDHMNTKMPAISDGGHHYHYIDVSAQLRAAEELHRLAYEFGNKLSTAVIVEKIYKIQVVGDSKGSETNLNFKGSRDNQKQEIINTFNVTMNLDKALPGVWDGEGLQDLGERLAEILRDEARRYGIKV